MIDRQISQQDMIKLTETETKCLEWLSSGIDETTISKYLNCSQHATAIHIQNAINKLEANSICHAVGKAMRLGLID